MSRKFNDLSQLTKAVLKRDEPVKPVVQKKQPPIPHPPKVRKTEPDAVLELSREEADCLAYFARTSLSGRGFATAGRTTVNPQQVRPAKAVPAPVAPVEDAGNAAEDDAPEGARLMAELEMLRRSLEKAEARAAAAERAFKDQGVQVSLLLAERNRRDGEIRSLRQKLEESARAREEAARKPTADPAALLQRPAEVHEAFDGEAREMVISALRDVAEGDSRSGRERRVAVLQAVLAANPPSGELARRRAELRQILKDCGCSIDPKTLEGLGFRLIGGRNHWKLQYENVRVTMAKTPSDYRASLNASSDLANRCF